MLLGALAWCAATLPGMHAFAFDQAALQRVLADPAERAHVLAAAAQSSVVLHNPCPSAHFALTGVVAIYRPPSFDSAGGVLGGAWRQQVREDGCGTSRLLNVLAFAKVPRTVTIMPLLPGTTHADPVLQRDARRFAVLAATGPEKNCGVPYVADTEFLQSERSTAAVAKTPPWRELWTLVSCTKEIRISMRFVPDSTGTQIVAERAPSAPLGSPH
jgi:hypothetical protein